MLPSAELEPAGDVPTLDDLPDADMGEVLEQVALIKLNGGLATTMGLQQPKSLIEARDGRTFLDIIVGQTLALRHRYDVMLPLILMDSQSTQEPTLEALAASSRVRRRRDRRRLPAERDPQAGRRDAASRSAGRRTRRWSGCRRATATSTARCVARGCWTSCAGAGIRYAMISNSDNLGAKLDPRIAAHMAAEQIPFLMEVVQGTEADRKGGHVARRRSDGQLMLRETAQTPPEDEESFRDYRRWRYYNTNNLWVDLDVLHDTLERAGGVLELPLIVNRKTVDPRDADSTPVIQLESAMGAAIESFTGASLLLVPRRASRPSRRPMTCSCCAPTSTGSATNWTSSRSPSGPTICPTSSSTSATTG